MVKTVSCPHCGKSVPWTPDSRWRPFCSERCRLIDLGDWLEERHRLGETLDTAPDPAPREDEVAQVRH
ncbi:DNA gyrase inhibitor YacG [Thermochromatium tepidum]|uniref:DNA gyrase inhibitor YacG n=1 Tax=Thermochromatium tepidum ATCC 43061 TaxID=316276 RepID=A0A6I6E5C8_THETI|nr:DNA gyrase inhibitor YacG [Thermochromatium tepidum]QGU31873.1 DNA gyrase inhibitor YacG [Thermochromatium tepidum ATCC 43061]